jgi:mono/diheme cytochrome c family protein
MRRVILIGVLLLLCGCERAMHNMYDQPKYPPGAPSPLFADGHAGRAPPFGTVDAASGSQAATSSGRFRPPADTVAPASMNADQYLSLLQRGQQRYDIYCAPCHGLTGAGNGMVVQRGFPAPLPFTSAQLMSAPDDALAQAIRRGYGVMYPFADRVDEHDNAAIVAYIRALELSQHADVKQLQARDLQALQAGRANR